MLLKLLVLSSFAVVCQGASREPWWIQMFFPNVSFTGRYHPSNYKVEKSPLYPDWAQNPNHVWSPAYWMPYKLAYSQYWIDYINNATEAEKQQAAQNWGENENGYYGNNQYGVNGQYDQSQNQYGGQSSYGQNYQQHPNGQYNVNAQASQQGQGQFGMNGQHAQVSAQNQDQIAQEAITVLQQVHTQTENMNKDFQEIAVRAAKDAELQMQAVTEEAEAAKKKIAVESDLSPEEVEKFSAQVDEAAETKIEAIAKQTAKFENDLAEKFEALNTQAQGIAVEAAEIAKKSELRRFQYQL